jgi:hypothetical protein
MRLLNFLNEKTFDIKQDVDYLYNLAFKPFISEFRKKQSELIDKVYDIVINQNKELDLKVVKTSELKSNDAKQAHRHRPSTIRLGIYNNGSAYYPEEDIIEISINKKIFLSNRIYVNNELSLTNIKGSIYHELSHWIDNALHNNHLDRMNITQYINYKTAEINAQVHSIMAIKDELPQEEYDKLSLIDLIKHKPNLYSVFKKVPEHLYDEYINSFIKRLHRERLLGKNMKKLSYQELQKRFK